MTELLDSAARRHWRACDEGRADSIREARRHSRRSSRGGARRGSLLASMRGCDRDSACARSRSSAGRSASRICSASLERRPREALVTLQAVKYTNRAAGQCVVSWAAHDGRVVLSVADTGNRLIGPGTCHTCSIVSWRADVLRARRKRVERAGTGAWVVPF